MLRKGSLTPQFVLIEESAPTQENVRSCICVLRAVMYLCVKGIKFASFCEFDKILELLRQCGIFGIFHGLVQAFQ